MAYFSVCPSTTRAADEAIVLLRGELPSDRVLSHLPMTSLVPWNTNKIQFIKHILTEIALFDILRPAILRS